MQDRTVPIGKGKQVLWSDAELQTAIDAYIYLLGLQQNGVECTESMTDPLRTWGPLANRNAASIRYRMRNISAVIQELGIPILGMYSPAEQVGTGVRERLRRMLLNHPSLSKSHQSFQKPSRRRSIKYTPRNEAIFVLKDLRKRVDDLDLSLARMGHNNPPEAIDPSFGRDHLLSVRHDIDQLEVALRTRSTDASSSQESLNGLIRFGLKVSVWIGQRLTKFVDAALITAAPIVVAKALDVMPILLEAIRSATQLITK